MFVNIFLIFIEVATLKPGARILFAVSLECVYIVAHQLLIRLFEIFSSILWAQSTAPVGFWLRVRWPAPLLHSVVWWAWLERPRPIIRTGKDFFR